MGSSDFTTPSFSAGAKACVCVDRKAQKEAKDICFSPGPHPNSTTFQRPASSSWIKSSWLEFILVKTDPCQEEVHKLICIPLMSCEAFTTHFLVLADPFLNNSIISLKCFKLGLSHQHIKLGHSNCYINKQSKFLEPKRCLEEGHRYSQHEHQHHMLEPVNTKENSRTV